MPLSSVKLKDEDDRVNVEPTTVAGISAFLGKLWKMVEDPKTDDLISWGKSGNTFVIKNQIDFAKTILPNYYKHNNIASFIRQLNMYGFHKIISTTSGALDSNDNDEIEFTHPCFIRGHPYLLEKIKRKMNNPKENFSKNDNGNQFGESIKRVLNDIKNLKGKQEHLGSQLSSVKQENEILWRELSLLRQKHAAQQNVLNKLIRFLVSLAQPSNHGIVKRRLVPLMLKDSSSSSRTKQEPIIQENDHVYTMKKREEPLSPGPTIHEIHPSEMLDNVQIIETPVMEVSAGSPVILDNEIITSPPSSVPEQSIPSPEPVPAALLLPTTVRKGKNRVQTVYVPSSSSNPSVPTHFLISQPTVSQHQSPEYLIPDNTDNPLMELVHETVADDDGDYITVVAGDNGDILTDNSSETVVVDKIKKKGIRKNTRKTTQPQVNVLKPIAPKPKAELKKKPVVPVKEKSESFDTNDFLVDIDLAKMKNITSDKEDEELLSRKRKSSDRGSNGKKQKLIFDDYEYNFNEPLVEIHTPSSSGVTSQSIHTIKDEVLKAVANPEEPIKDDLNINVDEIINIPSSADDLNNMNLTVDNPSIVENPLISPAGVADTSDDVVFNLNDDDAKSFIDKSKISNDVNKTDNEALMNRISECIDNAQNMKIACTDSSVPPSRAYVDDISMQLDTMQSDLNQLKELIQNEGLTLDVNTLMGLFNEDPLDYNMPSDSSGAFPKPNDKITGNELISAPSMFDFNDIFSQGDWSQPNTPLSTVDNDYCNLNTPQIESGIADENQSALFPPPSKKIKSK